MENGEEKRFEEYLETVSEEASERLRKIREEAQKTVPEAKFTFSYGVPTLKTKVNILMFAGFKKHIGIYPGPETIEKFKSELSEYELSKGAIRLPLDKELPIELIKRIAKYNHENCTV